MAAKMVTEWKQRVLDDKNGKTKATKQQSGAKKGGNGSQVHPADGPSSSAVMGAPVTKRNNSQSMDSESGDGIQF